jgi:hypothetical protein
MSYNFEIYEYENGMRKPQISRRMENEQKAICLSIINLEADLEDAITQRNELEEERMDREFIDHNVASVWDVIRNNNTRGKRTKNLLIP